MATPIITQFFPGGRRGPSRSRIFLLIGCLSFLTLCLFTSHLPVLQQLTSGGAARTSKMTSLRPSKPHHEREMDAQVLLQLIEQEKEKKLQNVGMEYGTNKHPPFKDDPPQLVGDLPLEHIPSYTPPSPSNGPGGGENETRARRLVFVGDVHGQLDALKALLRKINFDNKHGDHLVLAGDLVTKGPDSKGVVKFAMELGASAVRGNQEDKVLAAAREIHRLSVDDDSRLGPAADGEYDGESEKDDEQVVIDNHAETEKRKSHAHKVARSLSRAQLVWLRSLPIILRIGHIPAATAPPWNADTIAVVHGGLVPGVKLENQDAWAVMNMRSLVYPRGGKPKTSDADEDEDDNQVNAVLIKGESVVIPIEGREGEPWSHAWNRHQNLLPATSPHTLAIYGHDAKAGLQINPEVDISPYDHSQIPHKKPHQQQDNEHNDNNDKTNKNNKNKSPKKDKHKTKGLRYAFGLDSGCGHGRELTALVLEAGPGAEGGGVRHRFEQVKCEDPGDR